MLATLTYADTHVLLQKCSEVLYYMAFCWGSIARKQTHSALIFFFLKIHIFFSKFRYVLLVDFPIRSKAQLLPCVLKSQILVVKQNSDLTAIV